MILLLFALLSHADDGVLTLREALTVAVERNPTLDVANARIDQARALRRSEYTAFGPRIGATGTYARRSQEVRTEVGGSEAVLQARDAFRASGDLTVPLIDPEAFGAIVAANTGLDAQELESFELGRALGFRVSDAYLAVLAQERVLAAAERRVALADDLLAAAEARLAAGVGTRNDVTRTALERETAALEAVQARGQLQVARRVLATLLAAEDVGRLAEPDLADPPDRAVPPPDLRALALRADQAREEARATLLGYLPTVAATASATATNEAGFAGRRTNWTAGAVASWPLFDGGLRATVADRSRAVAAELDAQVEQLSLDVSRDIDNARIALDTARAGLEVAERRVAVAEQNARELGERFAVGLATALEVADAAAAEFDAATALARQRFEVQRAALALGDAMGATAEELIR